MTDVRALPFMPLFVGRLLASDTWLLATGDEAKAAVTLWARSWQQVPAGTLPADERILAALSGAGPRWRKVRDVALRGFELREDGRLHHDLIESAALDALAKLRGQQTRTAAATAARQAKRDVQRDVKRDVERSVPPDVVQREREREVNPSLPTVEKKAKAAVAPLALPGWLPAGAWGRFLEARIAMRAKATPHAQNLLIAELDRLRSQGHDPTAVLDQSVARAWRGLFPLKPDDAPRTAKHDRRDQVAGEIWTGVPNAKRPDENAIDGTAERVA